MTERSPGIHPDFKEYLTSHATPEITRLYLSGSEIYKVELSEVLTSPGDTFPLSHHIYFGNPYRSLSNNDTFSSIFFRTASGNTHSIENTGVYEDGFGHEADGAGAYRLDRQKYKHTKLTIGEPFQYEGEETDPITEIVALPYYRAYKIPLEDHVKPVFRRMNELTFNPIYYEHAAHVSKNRDDSQAMYEEVQKLFADTLGRRELEEFIDDTQLRIHYVKHRYPHL